MKTTLALLKLFSVWTLLTLPYVVEADITSNATCLSSFKWASNACGQNPCLVAAHLQSTCVSGSYSLAALGPNSHYIGPARDQANPCQCSSVVYSLMSACAACQGQNYDSWNEWNVNCQTVYLAVYPKEIPINTSVPQWAYVSLEPNGSFNVSQAIELAAQEIPDQFPPSVTTVTGATPSSTGASSTSGSSQALLGLDPRMQRITIGIIAAILFIAVGVTIAMIVLKIRQIRRRKLARRRHEASQEMVQRTGTVRSLGSNDEGLETVDVYGYGPVRTRPVIVAPAPRTPFYQLHINTERVSPITSWLRRRDSDDDTLNTTTPLIERHRNEDRASRLTSASNLSLPSLFSYEAQEVSPFTPAAESSDMYPGDSPGSEQRRVPPVDRDHYNTVALRDDGLPVGCHAPDSRYAAP